ncbi:MFS transporter [Nitrospirillum viridazoti]|uniref:MFS transporter n=1 Tax=Nitrospirillum viridazoti TaxID=3144925 RepID=UPI0011ABDAE3|nr:MFS transporter [Nitrospirillum amazonense]TWB43113.1 putative MFS family arabinose efflux permease [Nitrospirillum amazonense]
MGNGRNDLDQSVPNREDSLPTLGIYTVAVLCLTLILSFIDRFVINLVVDPIRSDLGLSDVEVSLLQGAGFALIFSVAALPAGRLADRLNRPRLIAAGVIVWSLGTMACGISADFWSFFVARIFLGFGEAALIPAASSLLIDGFSAARRGTALGIFSLGSTSGSGIALIVGGAVLGYLQTSTVAALPIIASLAPWRQLMILMGLPGFFFVPLLLLIREPAHGDRPTPPALPLFLRNLRAERGLVPRLCLAKGVMSLGDYGMAAWLPTLLMRHYAETPVTAGATIGIATALPGMIGSIAGGMLVDWSARRHGVSTRANLILGSYGAALCGAVLIGLGSSSLQIGLAFAIWVAGSVSGSVVGRVTMQEHVPGNMRATTVALSITTTALIGIAVGPTLVPGIAGLMPGVGNALQYAMVAVGIVSVVPALLLIARPASTNSAASATEN